MTIRNEMSGVEPLYQIEVTCTYCQTTFHTSRVRPSFKKAKSTDTDFCVYYKGVNPDYYVVRVCPTCGYACTENFSDKWTNLQRKVFEERVAKQWNMKDYGKERSWDEAVRSYKLALISAQIKGEKDRVIAGLLHHISWLYRYKGLEQQEKRFLQYALDTYVNVYQTEGGDVNNARLMYLIGELNRRLHYYNEAVQWFGRIINDKKIMDAAMIRASREQWAATREDMMTAQLEVPEEMKLA